MEAFRMAFLVSLVVLEGAVISSRFFFVLMRAGDEEGVKTSFQRYRCFFILCSRV